MYMYDIFHYYYLFSVVFLVYYVYCLWTLLNIISLNENLVSFTWLLKFLVIKNIYWIGVLILFNSISSYYSRLKFVSCEYTSWYFICVYIECKYKAHRRYNRSVHSGEKAHHVTSVADIEVSCGQCALTCRVDNLPVHSVSVHYSIIKMRIYLNNLQMFFE